jgi:hypothetical protein
MSARDDIAQLVGIEDRDPAKDDPPHGRFACGIAGMRGERLPPHDRACARGSALEREVDRSTDGCTAFTGTPWPTSQPAR